MKLRGSERGFATFNFCLWTGSTQFGLIKSPKTDYFFSTWLPPFPQISFSLFFFLLILPIEPENYYIYLPRLTVLLVVFCLYQMVKSEEWTTRRKTAVRSRRQTCHWTNTSWHQVSFIGICVFTGDSKENQHPQVRRSLVTLVIYGG